MNDFAPRRNNRACIGIGTKQGGVEDQADDETVRDDRSPEKAALRNLNIQ
jgi:hypothetical protein